MNGDMEFRNCLQKDELERGELALSLGVIASSMRACKKWKIDRYSAVAYDFLPKNTSMTKNRKSNKNFKIKQNNKIFYYNLYPKFLNRFEINLTK